MVQRAAQEEPLHRDPGQPEVARRLQVDRVERGGQVVRHVAGGELAEGLRPRDGQLARVAELLDRAPDLLHRGQPDGPPADLRDQRLDPLVAASPAQAVQQVGQPGPAHRQHRGHRVGRRFLGDALGEVKLQDQRRGALPAQSGQLLGNHQLRHGLSLCRAVRPPGRPRAKRGPWRERERGAVRVGYGRARWPIGTGTAGRPAATATGTGAGTARPGCWPMRRAERTTAPDVRAAAAPKLVGQPRRHLGTAGRRAGQPRVGRGRRAARGRGGVRGCRPTPSACSGSSAMTMAAGPTRR